MQTQRVTHQRRMRALYAVAVPADSSLTQVAVYRRTLGASLERVWENVHDWEHLPWLHAASFSRIALEEQGGWGWRARIGVAGGSEILLELVVEDDRRYVSRTLAGPGAASEIWTSLAPRGANETAIEVGFHLPGVAAGSAQAAKLGERMTALYTRLWDEDEAMMRERAAQLALASDAQRARASDGGGAPTSARDGLDLGDEHALRAQPPRVVEWRGRRYRVLREGGEWVAHAVVCPHWLGPLEHADVRDGQVTCPWHGYRFDVRSGRRCDAESPMRLAPAPRVVCADGRLRLVS